ncbi:MAG: hypothetical protein AB7O24_00170 [Kofleriaceae bacterium]
MRIVLIVFASLFLFLGLGASALLGWRDFKDAKEVASLGEDRELVMKMADASGMTGMKELTPGKLKAGGAGSLLAAGAALVLFVVMFVKKKVALLAGATCALAVIAIVLNPNYQAGEAIAAREFAIVAGVLTILGALCAFGADKLRKTA